MIESKTIVISLIVFLLLVLLLRYIQLLYAINYVKNNYSKINFSQSSPKPIGIPMFGFRSWGYDNGYILNNVNLTKTFPFSNVEIYKDKNGNLIVN